MHVVLERTGNTQSWPNEVNTLVRGWRSSSARRTGPRHGGLRPARYGAHLDGHRRGQASGLAGLAGQLAV